MKTILATLFVASCALSQAQSFAVTYDIQSHKTITGLSFAPTAPLHDLLGIKGLNATPVVLGGIDQFGEGAIGGELAFSVPVAKEFALGVGVGGIAMQGQKSHLLVSLGIERRF
jgi:hypothetical protein